MFRYLTPLLAAVTGLVYAGLGPFPVTGLTPNLLVAGAVVATVAGGLSTGTLWSVIGGLSANLLLDVPLGSLPLVLLAVAGLTELGRRALPLPVLVWIGVASAGGAVLSAVAVVVVVTGDSTTATGMWAEIGLVAIETALVALVAGVAVRRLGLIVEGDRRA